jgi:kynurenine 3-monooxygenase
MDNPTAPPTDFTIVGAGLAGALLACYLGRAGRRVDVYEKRFDPRGHDPEGGRSINLAISVRGIQALREVGLADEVLRQAIPMRGRMIHSPAGRLAFQPYGKDDSESINSVSRAGLNLALVNEAARRQTVRLFFRRRCTGVDLHSGAVELADEATGQPECVPARVVVGADGAYSAVRAAMQKRERFDYRQDYLSHGYKELAMPPGPEGRFLMEKHALHIWPRHSFMMIALPNLDGSFTCTLFLPYEGRHSFAALRTEADIEEFFHAQFPDALPLMPSLAQDFAKNPTGPLVTIRCNPWHAGGQIVLLGDACHAVVPFLGQGMNAAFEDCSVLHGALTKFSPAEMASAFCAYELQRKENVDTLADLCIDNFIEMRDRVSSPVFRLRKKVQVLLHKLFPRWYLPLYTLVTFTTTPYAQALRRARRQDTIVRLALAVIALVLLAIILLLIFR